MKQKWQENDTLRQMTEKFNGLVDEMFSFQGSSDEEHKSIKKDILKTNKNLQQLIADFDNITQEIKDKLEEKFQQVRQSLQKDSQQLQEDFTDKSQQLTDQFTNLSGEITERVEDELDDIRQNNINYPVSIPQRATLDELKGELIDLVSDRLTSTEENSPELEAPDDIEISPIIKAYIQQLVTQLVADQDASVVVSDGKLVINSAKPGIIGYGIAGEYSYGLTRSSTEVVVDPYTGRMSVPQLKEVPLQIAKAIQEYNETIEELIKATNSETSSTFTEHLQETSNTFAEIIEKMSVTDTQEHQTFNRSLQEIQRIIGNPYKLPKGMDSVISAIVALWERPVGGTSGGLSEEDLEAITAQLTELEESLRESLEETQLDVDLVNEDLKEQKNVVKELSTYVEGMDTDIQKINTDISGIKVNNSNLSTKVTEIDARVGNIETTLAVEEITKVLPAGSTSLTFTFNSLTSNSIITVQASDPTVEYSNLTVNGNTVTITFEPQSQQVLIRVISSEKPIGYTGDGNIENWSKWLSTRISSSKVITEEGKYPLDAIENNPNISGTLRNGLENVSGKVDRQIVNAWNDFDQNTIDGYIKLIRIKILSSYADIPLRFTTNGRKFDKPIDLVIRFNGVGGLDPDVVKYIADGNYNFYIAKETTGVWDIYAQHIPYETVFVTQAEHCRYKRKELFEVTYPNILVDSLPAGALKFKIEDRLMWNFIGRFDLENNTEKLINVPISANEVYVIIGEKNDTQVYGGQSVIIPKYNDASHGNNRHILYLSEIKGATGVSLATGARVYYEQNSLRITVRGITSGIHIHTRVYYR